MQKYYGLPVYNRNKALSKFVWENLGINELKANSQCKISLDVRDRQIRFIITTSWDFSFEHYVEWELQTYQDLLTERMKNEVIKIKKVIEEKLCIIEEEFRIENYKENTLERKCFYDIAIDKETYDNIMVLLKIQGYLQPIITPSTMFEGCTNLKPINFPKNLFYNKKI